MKNIIKSLVKCHRIGFGKYTYTLSSVEARKAGITELEWSKIGGAISEGSYKSKTEFINLILKSIDL